LRDDRVRACSRRHPSRPEAGERDGRRVRRGPRARLGCRSIAERGRRLRHWRRDRGDARLHGAGAGARRCRRRPPRGRVRPRRDARVDREFGGAGAGHRAEGAVGGGGRALSGRPGAGRRRQPLSRRTRRRSAPRAPHRSAVPIRPPAPPADTARAHLPRGPPVVPLGDAFLARSAASILAARTGNRKGGGILVKRVMFATLLGGFLGIFDGLTAWFTPDVRDQIGSIVIGSTVKGLVAGILIGAFATRVRSLVWVLIFG